MKEREGGCKGEYDCPDHHSGKRYIKTFKSPHIEAVTFSIFLYLICFLVSLSVRIAFFFSLCLPTIVKT